MDNKCDNCNNPTANEEFTNFQLGKESKSICFDCATVISQGLKEIKEYRKVK